MSTMFGRGASFDLGVQATDLASGGSSGGAMSIISPAVQSLLGRGSGVDGQQVAEAKKPTISRFVLDTNRASAERMSKNQSLTADERAKWGETLKGIDQMLYDMYQVQPPKLTK